MTNQKADQLATKLLDIEQQRNDLKRKYYERFKTALDPITAARFLQVENQIERLVDLQIASQLPVLDHSGK
jgi:vacuolar-type H+-ATPase subunit D/Vma8